MAQNLSMINTNLENVSYNNYPASHALPLAYPDIYYAQAPTFRDCSPDQGLANKKLRHASPGGFLQQPLFDDACTLHITSNNEPFRGYLGTAQEPSSLLTVNRTEVNYPSQAQLSQPASTGDDSSQTKKRSRKAYTKRTKKTR